MARLPRGAVARCTGSVGRRSGRRRPTWTVTTVRGVCGADVCRTVTGKDHPEGQLLAGGVTPGDRVAPGAAS